MSSKEGNQQANCPGHEAAQRGVVMSQEWAIPRVPDRIEDLDLVKRLQEYAAIGWPAPNAFAGHAP